MYLNTISLQDGVNNDLAIIAEWLKVNKLSLNIKKTHSMCFSAKNKATPCISLQIDGKAIAEIFISKFLGVIIDNELSWKDVAGENDGMGDGGGGGGGTQHRRAFT